MATTYNGGEIMYECRMCKKIFSEGHVPSGLNVLLSIISDGKWIDTKFSQTELYATTTHICGTSKFIGIADLIGVRLDDYKEHE